MSTMKLEGILLKHIPPLRQVYLPRCTDTSGPKYFGLRTFPSCTTLLPKCLLRDSSPTLLKCQSVSRALQQCWGYVLFIKVWQVSRPKITMCRGFLVGLPVFASTCCRWQIKTLLHFATGCRYETWNVSSNLFTVIVYRRNTANCFHEVE